MCVCVFLRTIAGNVCFDLLDVKVSYPGYVKFTAWRVRTCKCICAFVLDLDKGVSGRAKWQMALFLSCPCIAPSPQACLCWGRIGYSCSVCAGFEVKETAVVIPRELWFMCSVPHLSHYQEMKQHASDLLFRREREGWASQDHCVCLSFPRVHLSSDHLTHEHTVSRSVDWSVVIIAKGFPG